jgi:hypothetical protein
MDVKKIAATTQEQAIAAWVGLINQIRIDQLLETLSVQDKNFEAAQKDISNAIEKIQHQIISKCGGEKGLHGFLAEIAEEGISNAEAHIRGEDFHCVQLADNGPVDLVRDGQEIQMKFSQDGLCSLKAVVKHADKYPEFLEENGIYQIAKDHYETLKYYWELPKEEAVKLSQTNSEYSYRKWKLIHDYMDKYNLQLKDFEPSHLNYSDVQVAKIDSTMEKANKNIEYENQKIRNDAYEKSKPTRNEASKVIAVGGIIEGATSFVIAVKSRTNKDKHISDLTQEEWVEITKESGLGVAKGSVHGATTYTLTNFTATPAAVASAITTASFVVANQAYLLHQGQISETEFIYTSEIACLDAAVSALASLVGQLAIPVPVLGVIVGNTVGMLLYQYAKDNFHKHEIELIEQRNTQQQKLIQSLNSEYQQHVAELEADFIAYTQILKKAFSANAQIAFAGSIELAKFVGVNNDEILSSKEMIADYFIS